MIIHRVEKEFGTLVTEEYLYLKLLSQLDYLELIDKELNKKNG
jgi:hypothetical protein